MVVTAGGGGSVEHVAIGPEGKAEARIADVGAFAKAEQEIQIAVDWPALLGVGADKVPAWIAAVPNAGVKAVAYKKGVSSTRVLVLVDEKIEGGDRADDGPCAGRLNAGLKAQGFQVQDGRALLDKFGAERIVKMPDAQLRDAAKRVADIVVVGTAVSAFAANFGAATAFHKARSNLHAFEVASGAVIFTAPADEVKGKRPGDPDAAGHAALEALGDALAPALGAALKKSAEQ
jgi:hypothetical protein